MNSARPVEEPSVWSDATARRRQETRWTAKGDETRRNETNGTRERKSNARVITTRESPGKWTRTSDFSHGAATTEPLETSTSRRRPPLLSATSRSRHPDSPFDLSLSNHYPFSSLVLARLFRHCGFSSYGISSASVSLFLNRSLPMFRLLFLLRSYHT